MNKDSNIGKMEGIAEVMEIILHEFFENNKQAIQKYLKHEKCIVLEQFLEYMDQLKKEERFELKECLSIIDELYRDYYELHQKSEIRLLVNHLCLINVKLICQFFVIKPDL